MERSDFFIGSSLGELLYSYNNTIIYDYQEKKMAALSGKPLANLTKETLTKMRIDQSFDVFYPITLPARVKAWLAIQRLQESDALRPGWRLVS